jgi:hypothetical protein
MQLQVVGMCCLANTTLMVASYNWGHMWFGVVVSANNKKPK